MSSGGRCFAPIVSVESVPVAKGDGFLLRHVSNAGSCRSSMSNKLQLGSVAQAREDVGVLDKS